MFDLIIKNGKVFDGTGGPATSIDVGIKNDEISELGRLREKTSKKVIDATGLYVSPGFIDAQCHSDSYWTLFDYPHQESLLTQGITTVSIGHCGASLAPLASLEALKSIQKWHSLDGANFNWRYFDEYLTALARQPLGVNVSSLVGHSTMRRGLLGDAVRKVTAQEFRVLDSMLYASLKSGAAGLSLGLVYAHEYNTSSDELALLAKTVGKFDRLLSVHLRSEGASILESLDEAIHLAARSGARLKISHLKVRGRSNWPDFDQVVGRIERAYQKGVKIFFDVYPYDISWSVLYTYLPKWSYDGGRIELNKRLHEPYLRKKILHNLIHQAADLSNVTIATSSSSPHLVGRSIGQIAADHSISPEEATLNILAAAESEVIVFDQDIDKTQMQELLRHPLGVVATDGAGFDLAAASNFKNLVHPRCFGAMPRFLALSLREGLLPIETAIYKVTGMPAQFLGMARRGLIKKHAFADLVVFDEKKLADRASLQNPFQTSSGINFVIVNGKISVDNGKLADRFSGKVIHC